MDILYKLTIPKEFSKSKAKEEVFFKEHKRAIEAFESYLSKADFDIVDLYGSGLRSDIATCKSNDGRWITLSLEEVYPSVFMIDKVALARYWYCKNMSEFNNVGDPKDNSYMDQIDIFGLPNKVIESNRIAMISALKKCEDGYKDNVFLIPLKLLDEVGWGLIPSYEKSKHWDKEMELYLKDYLDMYGYKQSCKFLEMKTGVSVEFIEDYIKKSNRGLSILTISRQIAKNSSNPNVTPRVILGLVYRVCGGNSNMRVVRSTELDVAKYLVRSNELDKSIKKNKSKRFHSSIKKLAEKE